MITQEKRENILKIGLLSIIISAFLLVLFFACKKAGYHEDEYYSYYSTNYSSGWNVPDGEWVERADYEKEFVVRPGERFQYELVKQVQSWDVHPPMYYWILHTVCSLTPDIFSKWQGLTVNIVCYLLCIVLVFLCAKLLWEGSEKWYIPLVCSVIYAFSPAMISSAMFIRMYTLLSFWILLSVTMHLYVLKKNQINHVAFLCLVAFVSFCGFLTHYYYMIFQFFLTAATCFIFFFTYHRKKEAVLYGISILSAILIGIVVYPASLGQMFRGQRGAQATTSFFDEKNTFERIKYFVKLSNSYWFGSVMLLLCIALVVLFLIRIIQKKKIQENSYIRLIKIILAITCLGYFFVVSKTALMLGDSSVRYILPMFGPTIILLFVLLSGLIGDKKKEFLLVMIFSFMILCGNVMGICQGKVLFLYEEDANKVAFAKEHHETPVVYIYHKDSFWQIWDSANELLEYPEVYFTSDTSQDSLHDVVISESDELVVYVMNNTSTDEQMKRLDAFSIKELVRQEQFCDVYILKK